ncbi:cobyric acid synthase [Methanogenium marinum]|uniref:Probable cobyric acid synthase n=1 Tax=Methanogenium marinum TaxID=348610 RepID=A0A9Q4KW87_9EURY|nr:cobyric acid synthase [Methanogenium marinum]MDE4909060.1 cobyric acid synthase [Methanogenium marinum]
MSVMILGTASHVGKSITVTALCRILSNYGYRVAPFKSQNMSLNSYVTTTGDEIGIAQAVQALAARTTPSAEMNPILLKPKGDSESQIVLLGKPFCDVHIGEYYTKTNYLLNIALEAFWHLQDAYEMVVIEGAGGAAECNLYDRDIANILLAKKLRLPIILVADIERGGVFAQVLGTLMLLPDDVRQNVRGIIINKFCGDERLFEDGKRFLEEKSGIPVLGVIPYSDIPLPSEDSLSIKDKKAGGTGIRIAIIHLPKISNFTDFELLEQHASVEYIQPGTVLRSFDCIIIPGTKNTITDLQYLYDSGYADQINAAHKAGIPIIGICGGYQMLGETITDSGQESSKGVYQGLGLLNITTQFSGYEKTTIQVTRTPLTHSPILRRMGSVSGYEIHTGDTSVRDCKHAFDGEGAVSDNGQVFGTYMHGLFLNMNAVHALLSYLSEKNGTEYIPAESTNSIDDDTVYDTVAHHFEQSLDVRTLLAIAKEGVPYTESRPSADNGKNT